MSTFDINLDATKLLYRNFIVPGKTSWIDSRQVQTLPLEAGSYSFQFASGYYADFTFRVTAAGAVDYDASFDAFLAGRGTKTLTIVGFPVTIDARYLAGTGVLLAIPGTGADAFSLRTGRLVPASHYSVQQGSGQVAGFAFGLGIDGKFSYDASYDRGNGGFLSGRGTATLELLGFPLLIDTRAAGGAGLTLQPLLGAPFTAKSVEFFNLLPAASFTLQVNSGASTRATFSLDAAGAIRFDPSLGNVLELSSVEGLPLLRATSTLPA